MSRVILLPPAADLADVFAQDLIARLRAQLPDLAAVTILLPSPAAVAPVRRALARHAGRGLLGPRITTLAGFASQQPAGEPALAPLECRLLLTEALRRYRNLFPGQANAQIAEALFGLFEELTAEHVDPGADEAAFSARLAQAYAAPGARAGGAAGALPLAWLSREAQIVFKLWRAFTEDSGGRSPARVHLRNLRHGLDAATSTNPVHLVGFDAFSRGEREIVSEALRAGRAALWLQGREDGHDGAALRALVAQLGLEVERRTVEPCANAALLDAAFSESVIPAQAGIQEHRTPASAGVTLRLVEASSAEHEARCVDLAVRRALLDGRRDVVVLTQDRRLARRLRALLERAHVPLQDHAGWALSTSRAAAALDAWLECLEGRFRFRPLLDLLKSGFADVDPAALDRLERTLIYKEGIDGGLPAFIASAQSAPLEALLRKLQGAAFTPPRNPEARPARRWTESVLRSLDTIGLAARLQDDTAGAQLSRVLLQLDAAFARVPLALRWDEFRALLDGVIEGATFAPETGRSLVRLLTLEQSHALRCEFLIVAGATREQLPDAPAREPFFSEGVRAELGLSDWRGRQDRALARLRGALDGAGEVLITWSSGNDEEPAQASPWVEAIEAQAASGGLRLRDPELALVAMSGDCEIGDERAGAARRRPRPAPAAPSALLPDRLSATAHQSLLDCPYRFFAERLLGLRAEHAPDEDPDRSDYGERVHRILQAFTVQVAGHPAPFAERVTVANRARAQAKLEEIAQAVLGPDLDRRALALTWRAEFHASIPALLDWLIERPDVRDVRAEAELEQTLEGARLYGKVDRLETLASGAQVIVDYKTGKLPKREDVDAGEQVQLLHYALLAPDVAAVEYRPLRKDQKPLALGADALPPLRDRARERLAELLKQLRAGAKLPAQGDEKACEWCEHGGVCRREDWSATGDVEDEHGG